LAFRLLLLLGVRKGELVRAQWAEFDLAAGSWTVPDERSKTGAGFVVPLPALAVSWLEELRIRAAGSPWVFPARRTGRRAAPHMAGDTLNVALSRVDHGLPHFTVHDLRRTVRTQLAALGIPPHVAERCLNHKLRGVEGVYDRHDYLDERRAALEQWAAVLSGLDGGAVVVPLRSVGA
jgi:integrase